MTLYSENGDLRAPWWWKRVENGCIFLFTGAIPIVGLIEGMNSVLKQNLTMVVFPLIVLTIKSIGMVLDPNARPTNQSEEKELKHAVQELENKWTGDRADKKSTE